MDIVERLRFFAPKFVADLYLQPEQVMSDAADEIERLRKQNQTQALDYSASEGWWWDLIGKKVAEIERLRSRLEKPTPAMLEAGRAANRLVADNALGLACIAPDAAWAAMADMILSRSE